MTQQADASVKHYIKSHKVNLLTKLIIYSDILI